MDFSKTFAISAAGMAVERARVDVAALNLANANTVQSANGPSFQPLRVVARSVSAALVDPSVFGDQVSQGLMEASTSSAFSLPEITVEPSGVESRTVYEPGNPFANAKGFVTYPGVDTATEMITMMSALRSYEANVAAMNMAKTFALKALDIGGGS